MGSMFPRTKEEWEEYNYYKEYFSHPENVEKDIIDQQKSKRNRVGVKFYCSHTKEEVDTELARLAHELMLEIANTDITYLYKRPYPVGEP
jgi:acid phosphatase class B